ncbi:Phage tail fibers [Salmonella phage Se_EM4]|nr:Phage tail fibers [Salmonella phage Se_EM4]
MNEMFSQGGKGSTGILTNKQAVARYFGVKQSEVVYFSVGAVLSGYKVIYDKESQRAYSLPTDIDSGTTAVSLSTAAVLVHSAGSVDLGALAVSREEYVTLPGSFDSGSTLNVKNELLTYTDGKYRWDGVLPKTLAAGSTPATTGGIGLGAWISVGDASAKQWTDRSFRKLQLLKSSGSFQDGGGAEAGMSALLNSNDNYYYTPLSGVINVTPGSLPDSNWKCVGFLNGYDIFDVRNWSENPSPTDSAGIIANTSAIQFMADSLGDGGCLLFPEGTTTRFNTINITNRDVTISGGGVVDGTIRVYCKTFAASSDIYMNTDIGNLTFSTTRNLSSAIELAYARMGSIHDIRDVRGYSNAIHVIPSTAVGGSSATAWGQMVNRWMVSNCHYGKGAEDGYTVDRFIYAEPSPGMQYPVADLVVTGNEGHAKVDHIYIDTIDGLTVSSNIMFFPGGSLGPTEKKNSHIRINNGGGWLNINDNKFFESGGTSVYLNKCTRFSLHDNLYAFGSQRSPVPQIVIDGTPLAGEYFTQGAIHDETIIMPGGEGIYVAAKNGRLKIHDCNIQDPCNAMYYYGAAAQPSPVGITVVSDTKLVEVFDNTTREGDNALAGVVNNVYRANIIDKLGSLGSVFVETVTRDLGLGSATSTIDVRPWDNVVFTTAAHFDLQFFVNGGPVKNVTLTHSGTANFTIINSLSTKLAGNTNLVVTPGSSITFRVNTDGSATEVSRAII